MEVKIYKHTNIINGKMYIGQTVQNLERRARPDGSGYEGNIKFYNAIKKYGWHNFKSEILIITDEENADHYEDYFIRQFDSIKKGYNATFGGHKNKTLSQEHRNHISQSMIGITHKKRHLNMRGNGNPSAREVLSINLDNGVIRFHETTSQAIKDLNLPQSRLSCITKICKGKRKRVENYSFQYL